MQENLNIFVEGIPGSGKTTLLNKLEAHLPHYRAHYEGQASPVELAWCAYMTKGQYRQARVDWPELGKSIEEKTTQEGARYIVEYTKIKTDQPAFYAYMEQYEIYGGRRSLAEFKVIVLGRLEAFTGSGNIFECSFFQNIVEELMLFGQYDQAQILEFYREMLARINMDHFYMIRLKCKNIAQSIDAVKRERVNERGEELWYAMMLQYFVDSPYGKANGCHSHGDLLAHFQRRINIEDAIVKTLLGGRYLELESKNYELGPDVLERMGVPQ